MGPNDKQSNGKAQAIVALVAGIVGIVLSFVPFLGIGGSITGIVLGAIHRRRSQGNYRGMATAGIVTGIIGSCFFVLSLLFVFLLMYSRVAVSYSQ